MKMSYSFSINTDERKKPIEFSLQIDEFGDLIIKANDIEIMSICQISGKVFLMACDKGSEKEKIGLPLDGYGKVIISGE